MALAGVQNDEIVFAMCFKASGNVDDAKDKLQQLIYKTTGFISSVNRKADKLLDSLDFKWRIREDKVWLFASANPAGKYAIIIPRWNNILQHFLANDQNPQEVSASIKFAASPSDLINIPQSILCFEPLLEGFDIDLKAKLWSGFFKILQERWYETRSLRKLMPLAMFTSAKIDLEVEPVDFIPQRFMQQSRRKIRIPKGNIVEQIPQSKVEEFLDKLPLLESVDMTFKKFFDASEFKFFAKVYGKSLAGEVKVPGVSSLSPISSN